MDTLRLSDADREAAVDQLGEQYAVGRLTKDEFDERSDAVWSAKTRGDLAPVFVDLPASSKRTPARTGGRQPRRGRPWGFPFVAVVFVLVAITVVTHLPFVLLAVALWLVFGRCHQAGWRGPSRM